MIDLETVVEQQLIDKLCSEESQWTFRDDLRTEEALWANFKYILEQNNKDILEDQPLSDIEFQEVKNSVSHASFYEAGQWLIGENGEVHVTIHRNEKKLHLLVLNNEHIAGGTSVYEVIHQYQSPKRVDTDQDRRFDVTLLINGLPLIHIELKNKNAHKGYWDAFYQIKKYIGEGKFTGLFSNVQMFVISNETETKYFAPARASELNEEFLTGWVDSQNQPVHNYLEFANEVLRIPLAHEMVTKYKVLDAQKKQVLILRPYQIHAIEAMRKASKENQSGFIWHTTGSGKTMTSYKATRNLLMDIPSLDKTVFLIDRQDLDLQTTTAFQAYAESDTIDVEDTDDVQILIKKLSDGKRDMIVTTRQKLQYMINTRFNDHALGKVGSRARQQRDKIRSLRIAFVVDECHRAVTPQTKRDIERFFSRSLWFGFTGTPIFASNKYEKKGDLSQTTEELYGPCLHNYTIKEAIREHSVLGFSIECLGPQGIKPEEEEQYYQTQKHMRNVLNVILNKSTEKFGLYNGSGRSYVAMLTVDSIAKAQDYYALLKKIKCGEDTLRINEDITKLLPKDFPKVAITFSITENDESSKANQDAMKSILEDYNHMFGTSYTIEQLRAYNNNLNERLARKKSFYLDRKQQIDLVIVVDRLLTGFDAPCLSTLFIDRPPMKPQGLIQAFSRTNRIFDTRKQYGQIVTFRSPHEYKESIDAALKLYSRGDFSTVVAEDWDTVLQHFTATLRTLHTLAPHSEDALNLSREQKKSFVLCFRSLDHDFAHLKSFTCYTPTVVERFDFSQDEYDDYAANYKSIIEELNDSESDDQTDNSPIIDNYDLVAFDTFTVDYDYLVRLLQGVFDSVQSQDNSDSTVIQQKIIQLRDLTTHYADNNQKLSQIILDVLNDCEKDPSQFAGKDASYLIYQIRSKMIRKQVQEFANTWFLPYEDVDFAVTHCKNGHINNPNQLKEKADYSAYKRATDPALPKFKFHRQLITAFDDELMPGIRSLL